MSSSEKGVMSLANGIVTELVDLAYVIPAWVLTTFNDYGDGNITKNVDLRIVTDDVDAFNASLNSIVFSGGGDTAEEATQGWTAWKFIYF